MEKIHQTKEANGIRAPDLTIPEDKLMLGKFAALFSASSLADYCIEVEDYCAEGRE